MTHTERFVAGPGNPCGLRKITASDIFTRLYIDTEDHDLGLLRSIADAVNNHEGVVDLLRQYADLLDQADREDDPAEKRSLAVEADEVRDQIDGAMDWQPVGEGLAIALDRTDTEAVAGALTRVAAERIAKQNPSTPASVVADLRRAVTGGAA